MDPKIIIAAALAGIDLLESLIPELSRLVQTGEITAEQQATVLARYESLRARAEGQFSGPAWEVTGRGE